MKQIVCDMCGQVLFSSNLAGWTCCYAGAEGVYEIVFNADTPRFASFTKELCEDCYRRVLEFVGSLAPDEEKRTSGLLEE